MTKKESRPPKRAESGSSPPSFEDMRNQRTAFVSTFFKKGAEITEELVKENERLRAAARKLETENTALRTQLKSDDAIREALKKIEELEREKDSLLSQFSQVEAVTTRFTARHSELEEELANLANVYVASYQLHSTLNLPSVVRHLRELLAQLVGAQAHAVYVVDPGHKQLVPISCDGVEMDKVPRVALTDAPTGGAAIIERVFLTGIPHIEEGALDHAGFDSPAACLPMRIDDRAIGVIAIFEVLPQKDRFTAVDFELFKMMAAHAATALTGAMLYAHSGEKLPSLDVFHDAVRDAEGRGVLARKEAERS